MRSRNYCKLFTRYDQSILTLAILTDSNKSWHPKHYGREVFGFSVISFNFWTHKLLEYQDKKQELEASNNPFSIVILVHLIFLETKQDPNARFLMKLQLTRRLYDKGWGRDYVINLFKVIDWALIIPENLELEYKERLHELEEERKMSYVTSFQRLGREEGFEEGINSVMRIMQSKGFDQGTIEEILQLSKKELEQEKI